MAFRLQNLRCISTGAYVPGTAISSLSPRRSTNIWQYVTDESLTLSLQLGYFNSAVTEYGLQSGDTVMIVSEMDADPVTAEGAWFLVTTISPNVILVPFQAPTSLFFSDGTDVGTTAVVTEETLGSQVVLGNLIPHNGAGILIKCFGRTAANANNKTVRVKFAGSTLLTIGPVASNNEVFWVETRIIRTGAATASAYAWGDRGTTLVTPVYSAITPTWSANNSVVITGQNGTASANDIVLGGWEVGVIN